MRTCAQTCAQTCATAPLESSRRGGHLEYRHAYARAIDTPVGDAEMEPLNGRGYGHPWAEQLCVPAPDRLARLEGKSPRGL